MFLSSHRKNNISEYICLAGNRKKSTGSVTEPFELILHQWLWHCHVFKGERLSSVQDKRVKKKTKTKKENKKKGKKDLWRDCNLKPVCKFLKSLPQKSTVKIYHHNSKGSTAKTKEREREREILHFPRIKSRICRKYPESYFVAKKSKIECRNDQRRFFLQKRSQIESRKIKKRFFYKKRFKIESRKDQIRLFLPNDQKSNVERSKNRR